MLDKNYLEKLKEATILEIAGLENIAKAHGLLDTRKESAMDIEGDPQPADQEVVLSLTDETKEASVSILRKVAADMADSDDIDVKVQACEVNEIADEIEKNAFVYERDNIDPEVELDKFFRDGVIEAPKGEEKKRWLEQFRGDDTAVVAEFMKNPAPFQKV